MLPIAIQLFSVRDEAAADMRGTLEKIKAMGYDGVEFAGLYGYAPADLKAMCDEIGLTPISAHVNYLEYMADMEGTIGAYAEIGCKYAAIPWLGDEFRPGRPGFETFMKDVAVIGRNLKEKGIYLLYHNHDFEFEVVNGKYVLDAMYEEIPADVLGTELDTCWVRVGGEEPAAFVRKYTGRAPIVHLKDFVGGKTDNMYELIGVDTEKKKAEEKAFEFRPVGYGCQDMPAIIAAAVDAGAEWLVVEQDHPSMGLTPMECAAKSIEYLRSLA